MRLARPRAAAVAAAAIAVTGLAFATNAYAASYTYRSTDYKFWTKDWQDANQQDWRIYTYIDHKDGYTPYVRSRIENNDSLTHGNRIAIKAYGYRNGDYCMDAVNYNYYGPGIEPGFGGWSKFPPYCGAGKYKGNGYGCAEAGLPDLNNYEWFCYYGYRTPATTEA